MYIDTSQQLMYIGVIFDAGFSTPITSVSVADIDGIVRAVCLHTVLAPVKCELDQRSQSMAC